jgi:hypothetical protein
VRELKAKIKDVKELEQSIKDEEGKLQKLGMELKKAKKERKGAVLEEIEGVKRVIQEKQKQLEEERRDKEEWIKKYYIPLKELYTHMLKTNTPDAPLSDDLELYGIDGLVANLPNKAKITIIPPPNQLPETQSAAPTPETGKQNDLVLNESYLSKRLHENIGNLTEAELEGYSKHKTQMMYSQHFSGYKFFIMFGFFCFLVLLKPYFHNSRMTPVSNSLIEQLAFNKFLNHQHTTKLLQTLKISKNNVKFSQVHQGGKRSSNFKCSVDVQGVPGAKILMEGTQKSET